MFDNPIIMVVIAMLAVFGLLPLIVNAFYRTVEAGEIRLVSGRGGAGFRVYRGPCKAWVIPLLTSTRVISASAINVDIEITDQTADVDVNGKPAPVKVTVKASAIVSVGENDAMVNTAANKFFSKPTMDQLSTLTDVLSSAGRRAINLLKHDQLFNARSAPQSTALTTQDASGALVMQADDDELAVIIKDACSRELLDLGLTFNSLNIKAVLSEVAEARRRESAARAKASADVVQAQEEQRSRIAQLEAQQKVNDQEKNLNMQIASNGAAIARAEAEKQAAVRQQREAELAASQITQARADAEQNVIQQEADGRAQASRIRLIAEAEAEAIRMKAQALMDSGQAYLDLRRLEMAPALTREVASALSNGQFVNFGTTGSGGHSAAASGSDDVMRVVQTLMAAQVIGNANNSGGNNSGGGSTRRDSGTGSNPVVVEPERALISSQQTAPTVPSLPQKAPIRKS
jgi:flotillin